MIREEVSDEKAAKVQQGVQAGGGSAARVGQKSPTQLALELGVRRNQFYKWKEQLAGKGDGASGRPGRKPAAAGEIARLKRELAKVTEERDILRKSRSRFTRRTHS